MKVRHTLTPGDIEKGANVHTKGTRGVYEAPKTSRDSASVKEATAATKLQAMQRGKIGEEAAAPRGSAWASSA